MNEELIEKCCEISHDFYVARVNCHGDCYRFKLEEYLAKAIPLISAQARKQLVPDGCENVGVEYRFYPGGVECVLTYRTEVGFEEAKAFIEAPMNYYDRQSFAVEAMKQALKEGGKEAE